MVLLNIEFMKLVHVGDLLVILYLRIIIGRKYKACIQDMSVFEFYSKTECSEFDIRQVFAELHWGVLWKITRLPTDVGWRVLVYYATMTKVVADQVWVRGWNVKKLK